MDGFWNDVEDWLSSCCGEAARLLHDERHWVAFVEEAKLKLNGIESVLFKRKPGASFTNKNSFMLIIVQIHIDFEQLTVAWIKPLALAK